MARFNFLGVARDQFGNLQPNIDIYVYLTGTSTAATVYATRTGGSAITTAPQIVTDTNGRYNFYIDNGDYNISTQRFDVVAAGLRYTDIEVARGIPPTSAASVEQDQRLTELINQSSSSVSISAASREQDQRLQEQIDLIDITPLSAASREQDQRLQEQIDLIDITPLSAASREQDQRLQEQIDLIDIPPSGNIINRSYEYTDAQILSVSAEILSVSAASIEQDQRLQEQIDSLDTGPLSAASREQDQRLREAALLPTGTGSVGISGNLTVNGFVNTKDNYYINGVPLSATNIINNAAGVLGLGEWKYETNTTPPPSDESFRFNNSDPELATKFYIDYENIDNSDLSNIITLAEGGEVIYLQEKKESRFGALIETNSFTDQITYGEFDIELLEELDGGFRDGKEYAMIISFGASNTQVASVSAASREQDKRIKTPDVRKVDDNWWVTSDDDNTILLMDNPTSSNVYLGGSVAVGTTVVVMQRGTGTVTAATSGGSTILSADDLVDTRARYSTFTATCVSASLWMVSGDLA